MLTTVLLVIHVILVAIMIGLIMLQKSEGGALGMGSGNLMSARGTANLLTRSTGICAVMFFVSTLVLAITFKGATKSASILENTSVTEASSKPTAPKVDTSKPAVPTTSKKASKKTSKK